ncbi:hybrid sensor histidine kinase/response regulator transcription factor [Flavivirga jejuensis]|uniref:histidine kinase n=1 Tax=Flavivirga jejuensis TaxID=870487 RepID=A0ABT8WKL7_9FLAO|nr:two-component regulator propeller domain-containing protein [Flavivirga jejuensis]MDO5973701.1 two-component regulator propeller domain-containing protein [Flavivirga jejuensis]
MNFKICIIFVSCFLSNPIFGQLNNLKFENLDTVDGLSSSTCLEVFQDKEGFLWFGTIDGLNKYNGYEFEIYRSVLNDPTSISNNRINAIEEDNEGYLWIGTNNGLNLFNKKTNSFVRINLYKQISLSTNPRTIINDLLYDAINNTLWVATNNGVIKIILDVFYKDATTLKFSYYKYNPSNLYSIDNNSVNIILKDKENTIWVGTNGNNLNKYNFKNDNFERIYITNKKHYELDHIPKKILIDIDNDFWIGNDLSNLVLWNKKEDRFSHISLVDYKVPIRDFYQDKNGLFWVSTDGYGIFIFEKEENKIQRHIVNNFSDSFSIPNNKPTKVFEGENGIFWIGSYDKGVSKLDPSKYSFGHYYYQPDNPNGLSEKIVQSVLEDSKERIWVGTYNGGLNLFDKKNNSFQHFSHNPKNPNSLSSNKILYTFETQDGNIWVCTLDGGLNKFNPETKKVERFFHKANDLTSIGQNSVWAGVEDSKNRLWLGLRTEGLSLYDQKTKHFYNYKNHYGKENSLASNDVIYTFIDSKERLFIGTSLGLNVVYLNKLDSFIPKEIDFIGVKGNGIEGNGINYVTEDHLGNIWVGADSGIYKLDENVNLVRSYSSQDGLPNNLVVGIKEDNNHNFWITTKSGLSFLDSKTDQFKNFNAHDGLQGTEYQRKSIEKTKDGQIIIGGINGLNIFNPNDISLKTPDVIYPKLTSFKLNNKKIVVGDTVNKRVLLHKTIDETQNLTLRHNENYISFEFLALYFENPEQVQYAYKMYGLDEEFVNVGSRRDVNYSNLLPGDYMFEVKASTDGQWQDAQTTKIELTILSPPWKTWWAYILYFVLGVLLFFLIMRYYTLKVKEVQEHELDQMKLQFFVNVSHEFRTPLTLILNPVDKILSSFNNDPEVIKESARSIQRSSRRLLHLVNQLLDYRKMDVGMAPLQLEKGDVVKFCEDIFSLFKGLATKKEINYNFVTSSEKIISLFDFDKIEKIITNLISNAVKFTNSGGEITVSINKIEVKKRKPGFSFFKNERLGKYVEIIVKDSGIGLNAEQLKNVFSRFYNVDITKTGTGIGLNFTKALVELHGGEIFVESEYLKGSKFVVRIPLDIKAAAEKVENVKNEFLINSMNSVEYEMSIANDELALQTKKVEEDRGKLPTLLLVEDNKELRLHLKNDLRNNYIVKEAVNGDEGLKMAKKYYPDIIISDVMMPVMDGFEMCRLVKTEFETCHIPIILLTAKTLEVDRIKGYDSGADGYLPKPFITSVLKARIKNLLETKNRLRKRFSEIGGVFPSSDVTTNNLDEVFLDKTTKIIIKNISDIDFKQENLLKELGIGKSQLYRKINSLTGHNPSYFIRTIRLRYASDLLQQNRHSIKEVTHMSGFNSTAYFSKTFKELFNVTPTEFIEQNVQSTDSK